MVVTVDGISYEVTFLPAGKQTNVFLSELNSIPSSLSKLALNTIAVILVKLVQPRNAPTPMEVALDGMRISDAKDVQPSNALIPMVVTDVGIELTSDA